jgi:hypothetical protein
VVAGALALGNESDYRARSFVIQVPCDLGADDKGLPVRGRGAGEARPELGPLGSSAIGASSGSRSARPSLSSRTASGTDRREHLAPLLAHALLQPDRFEVQAHELLGVRGACLPQVERRPRRWLEQMLTSRLRLLLTTSLIMLGAVVSPLGEGVAVAHPTADFEWAPKPVVAGTPVTFVSTSTPFHEPYAPITKAEWTIQGAGTFTGNQVTVTAPAAGQWTVRLHVWDASGEDGEVTKVINVLPPPAPPPPPPPPANQPPTPALGVLPASPVVGEEVTFFSSSEDADGRISEHAWDLNGDGAFDRVGAVVTNRFSTAGDTRVTLRVTDDKGASATVARVLSVRQPLVPALPGASTPVAASPQSPRLLSPFPVVRLIGSIVSGQTIVRMLQVRSPAGALVLVRCRGASCPVKRVKKVAGKARLRFAAFEQELLPGVVLEVFVRRGERIGKYTRFAIRRNGFPKRTDACLRPGTTQRIACPAR